MKVNHNETWTGRARHLRAAMMLLLMLSWMLPGIGCALRRGAVEIPADRWVMTLRAGQQFTAPVDGKFVPEARWNEMRDVYIQHSHER
jgi:hypothetical protein